MRRSVVRCVTRAVHYLRAKRLFVNAGVQECAEAMAAAGVPEFAKSFRFNLPDAFARDREMLPNLFEGVFAAVLQTEAHFDDLLFARTQRLQHLGSLLP